MKTGSNQGVPVAGSHRGQNLEELRVIRLPESVEHLGQQIRQHRELIKLLKATRTQLGGGTVLAALWGEHRVSTDLDLMMPAAAFDEHQETIRQMLSEIPANEHSAIVDKTTKRRIVLAARGINGLTGDIEIVRDQLGDSMRSANPDAKGEGVWDVRLMAEATAHILAKKIDRLGRRDLERDHYDLVWAAYHDPERLKEAVKGFTTVRQLTEIARRAQKDPERVFENEEKPVREPKAPEWKNMLGPVWQTIARLHDTPAGQPLTLPQPGRPGCRQDGPSHGW